MFIFIVVLLTVNCITECDTVGSTVLTIRMPRGLKEKMKKAGINWSKGVRRFIEDRIRSYELLGVLEEIRSRARKRRARVDSTLLIREDREKR